MVEFDRAPFGIVGLETAVSLIYDRFVRTGILSLDRLAQLFSCNPARILNLQRGTLAKESWADISVIDPELNYEVVRLISFHAAGILPSKAGSFAAAL